MLLNEDETLEEAIKVALRSIAAEPTNRDVRRFFCSVMKRGPRVLQLLLDTLRALGRGTADAKSLSFLAAVAKEYSAVDAAISLAQLALASDQTSTAYALSLVHLLEIDFRTEEAMSVIRSFLEANPEFSVGGLVAAKLLDAWVHPTIDKDVILVDDTQSKGVPNLSVSQLEFMALLFVLVKLLYLSNSDNSKFVIASIAFQVETERRGL